MNGSRVTFNLIHSLYLLYLGTKFSYMWQLSLRWGNYLISKEPSLPHETVKHSTPLSSYGFGIALAKVYARFLNGQVHIHAIGRVSEAKCNERFLKQYFLFDLRFFNRNLLQKTTVRIHLYTLTLVLTKCRKSFPFLRLKLKTFTNRSSLCVNG